MAAYFINGATPLFGAPTTGASWAVASCFCWMSLKISEEINVVKPKEAMLKFSVPQGKNCTLFSGVREKSPMVSKVTRSPLESSRDNDPVKFLIFCNANS